MFRVFVEDLATFKLFLDLNDSEYVDAFLSKGRSTFVSDSPEIFGCIGIKTETGISDVNTIIRVPRKVLLNLVDLGSIDFCFKDDKVRVTFNDSLDTKMCEVSFTRQDVYADKYKNKMELLTNLDNTRSKDFIDVSEYDILCRAGNSAGAIISANLGVICIRLSGTGRIYKRLAENHTFSITASALKVLTRCSDKVFNIENFLGSSLNGLTVLATKCRGEYNEEFNAIEESGSRFKCDIELGAMRSFIAKVRPTVDYIELDLDGKVCLIDQGRLVYSVPIRITNVISSGEQDLGKLKIPMTVIKEAIFVSKSCGFKLSKKRNFTHLENKDMIILF